MEKSPRLEFIFNESDDPCEVYFNSYQEIEGRQWPKDIKVQFGNNVFSYSFTEIKAEEKAATAATENSSAKSTGDEN